ncbi:hypothetical protein [Microbulbifer hainanensis]|uniref:hypothetical protein n=1 Tax=Microbulbifer hainanensis TaxID=2735675 RepID=UPI00186931D9|nr:hypothetical protein [Microbulbifer hainanensis]
MNKIFSTIAFLIFNNLAFSNCSEEQETAEIEMNIQIEGHSSNTATQHEEMDLFKVEVPASVSGIPLVAMFLTEGEVASFWIPVSYRILDDKAIFQFPAYRDSIKDFEVAAQYESGSCLKYVQKLLE